MSATTSSCHASSAPVAERTPNPFAPPPVVVFESPLGAAWALNHDGAHDDNVQTSTASPTKKPWMEQSAIRACLSPYYDLAEWEDRYITKSLGVEVQEFGSADHPPRSPLKEFSLSSDGEYDGSDDDDDDDGFGGDTVPAGRGAKSLDCAVHLGGGGSGGGNDDGDGAGEKMQEEDEDEEEEEEEDEDAATGAGATGGEEFGAGSVGGGRARSGGGAGGGAAAAPMPAKAADAAGSKGSPHLDRPAIRRTSHSAPSSSTGEIFHGAEKQRSYGTSGSPRGAGGGGAVEVDEMEVQ